MSRSDLQQIGKIEVLLKRGQRGGEVEAAQETTRSSLGRVLEKDKKYVPFGYQDDIWVYLLTTPGWAAQ